MTIQAPTKSYTLASVAALVIGTVAYGIGLVNAEMPLNLIMGIIRLRYRIISSRFIQRGISIE